MSNLPHAGPRPAEGMESILAILRGSFPALTGDAWAAVIRRAEQQGVLPLVAQKLHVFAEQGQVLPFRAERRLARAERLSVVDGMRWVALLREVLQKFAAAGIPAAPLKGPSLAQRLYGSAMLRTYRDLDILLPRAQEPEADAVMASLGFVRGVRDSHQQSPWFRDSPFGAMLVELHFELEDPLVVDLDTPGIWQRASASDFGGVPVWQLAASDELVFLCTHAARHHFDRMTLVADLVLAFDRYGAAASAEDRDWRRSALVPGAVLLGHAMAEKLQRSVAPEPWQVEDHVRNYVEKLAEDMWTGMMSGAVTTPDRTVVYGFFAGLEPTWTGRQRRRLSLLRLLLTQTVALDRENAARWGLKGNFGALAARQVRLIAAACTGKRAANK